MLFRLRLAFALPLGIGVVGLMAQTPQAEVDAAIQSRRNPVGRFAAVGDRVGVIVMTKAASPASPLLRADGQLPPSDRTGLRHQRRSGARAGDIADAGGLIPRKTRCAPDVFADRHRRKTGARHFSRESLQIESRAPPPLQAGLAQGKLSLHCGTAEALVEWCIDVIPDRPSSSATGRRHEGLNRRRSSNS